MTWCLFHEVRVSIYSMGARVGENVRKEIEEGKNLQRQLGQTMHVQPVG